MDSRIMMFAIAVLLSMDNFNNIAFSQTIDDPGVPCYTTENCADSRLPAGATCTSGFCICMNERGIPRRCLAPRSQPRNPVHSTGAHICKTDRDCEGLANTYCNTTVNQCSCSDGFVMSMSKYECLPISYSLGLACDQNDQCSFPNSVCSASRECVCGTGYHYTENSCWKSIEINTTCKDTQECNHVVNAICNEESICSCAQRDVLGSDGQRCLSVAEEMHQSCVDSNQCSIAYPSTECIEGTCRCTGNNHFAASELLCVPTKHVGENCTRDNECHQDNEHSNEHTRALKCQSGVCVCNENFSQRENRCEIDVVSGASSLSSFVYVILPLLMSALLFSAGQ